MRVRGNIAASPANVPVCPTYCSTSSLVGRVGYYGCLTDAQAAKALDIFGKCIKIGMFPVRTAAEQGVVNGEHPFLMVLRFARARNFQVEKAFKMISDDFQWRQKNREWLSVTDARTILGCDPKEVYHMFPTWFQGICKEGRLVTWKHFGCFDLKLFDKVDVEKLVRFHVWETEQIIRLGQDRGRDVGHNVAETFCVIIDAEGWNLSHITSKTLSFIRGMAESDSLHFPERLGALHVINAVRSLGHNFTMVGCCDKKENSDFELSSGVDSEVATIDASRSNSSALRWYCS